MPLYTFLSDRVQKLETPTFNTQTGTSYTLVATDAGKIVGMNNAAANTLYVPTDASVDFPIGTQIVVRQVGVGPTTIAAVTPATTAINPRDGAFDLGGRYAWAVLVKIAANSWELTGDVTT